MTQTQILSRLRELLADTFEIDPARVTPEADLYKDLDLDSIDALELGVALHKKYRLKLEQADQRVREHFRSVRTLAEFIRAQGAAT